MRYQLGHFERVVSKVLLSWHATHAQGNPIDRIAEALEVSYEQCHQIGGHPLRRGKGHGMRPRARARRVRRDWTVRDRRVSAIDDRDDVERGLQCRFVEAWEGPARVGGFELGDCVSPLRGLTEIQSRQLLVQDARELHPQPCLTGMKGPREAQRGLLLLVVECDRACE